MRILIVEDNADILANVFDYLQLKGYTVDCAQDGLGGLHLAVTQSYDLIVLDVMLPGIDGFQICTRLREDAKLDILVIMLPARDTLDDRIQGANTGVDDYLVKPFALSELHARIQAVLRRAKADLLIIDNFGLKPMHSGQDEDFHDVIAERYERRPTIITSNLDVSVWNDAFHNKLLGAATLDRIMHGPTRSCWTARVTGLLAGMFPLAEATHKHVTRRGRPSENLSCLVASLRCPVTQCQFQRSIFRIFETAASSGRANRPHMAISMGQRKLRKRPTSLGKGRPT